MRINKYLARCSLGSRRQVEELVTKGLVAINGKVCTDLTTDVNPESDIITCRGKKVEISTEKIYIMINKPVNYLVSNRDDFNRKLVFDLLPDFGTKLFAIGRLDYNSEGLLLLTNDGDFANRIIHPRYKLPKLYKVTVKGYISNEQVEMLRKGVDIESGKTGPALVHIKKRTPTVSILKITIYEGKKRQIRYMLKAVKSEVIRLKRLQIGDLKLGKLPVGMWRPLKPAEITSLLNYRKTFNR